jgi:hypothetical protein
MNDPLTTEARTPSRCLTGTTRNPPPANPPRGGLDSSRVPRGAHRNQVDPAILPGRRAARRSFWGVTSPQRERRDDRHSRARRGNAVPGPTPYICLVPPGADTQTRTFPVPKQLVKGQAHLRGNEKTKKIVRAEGTYLDFRGHISVRQLVEVTRHANSPTAFAAVLRCEGRSRRPGHR